VTLEEVTICSPFHPHQSHLGTCGAHFVGINSRGTPWAYYGKPADECRAEFFARHLPELRERVGLGCGEPTLRGG
jgi:hypothetical protein